MFIRVPLIHHSKIKICLLFPFHSQADIICVARYILVVEKESSMTSKSFVIYLSFQVNLEFLSS